MIIDCPHCKSRVDATVHGERAHEDQEDPFPLKVAVLECPSCHNTLVGVQEYVQGHPDQGEFWTDAERIWPFPKRNVSRGVPEIVRNSLEEADRCYQAGAYAACAVMCGRALEAICIHHKTSDRSLASGLKELRENEIIDKRLFTWGEELRKVRNLGAHASVEKIPQDDARDVLDFTHAITDYIFVLSGRFDSFMRRRNNTKEKQQ